MPLLRDRSASISSGRWSCSLGDITKSAYWFANTQVYGTQRRLSILSLQKEEERNERKEGKRETDRRERGEERIELLETRYAVICISYVSPCNLHDGCTNGIECLFLGQKYIAMIIHRMLYEIRVKITDLNIHYNFQMKNI